MALFILSSPLVCQHILLATVLDVPLAHLHDIDRLLLGFFDFFLGLHKKRSRKIIAHINPKMRRAKDVRRMMKFYQEKESGRKCNSQLLDACFRRITMISKSND